MLDVAKAAWHGEWAVAVENVPYLALTFLGTSAAVLWLDFALDIIILQSRNIVDRLMPGVRRVRFSVD